MHAGPVSYLTGAVKNIHGMKLMRSRHVDMGNMALLS